MRKSCSACSLLLLGALALTAAPRKVVLIAGVKSHGPKVHEYLKSVKLLKVLLDENTDLVSEVHFNGWPENPATLDTASTIVVISDGQPSDRLPPMPLMTPERMEILERQRKRGCGIVAIHYSTFITYRFAEEALRWQGGYYEWKPGNGQTSLIKTIEADVKLPTPSHPILSGIQPFRLRDEFYYRLRLHADHVPLLQIPDLPGTPAEQTVAWAMERSDGGRGFATTTGHFFSNWQNNSYRKLILNAILWTAQAPLPAGGVASRYVAEPEVNRRFAKPAGRALVIANPEIAEALRDALDSEIPRFLITTVAPGAPLPNLREYRLVVAQGPAVTPQLKRFVRSGGGLVLIGGATAEPRDGAIEIHPHEITRRIPPFEVKADGGGNPPGAAIATATTVEQVGKGRIFRTHLGRDAERIANPGVTQLILYGSLWAGRIIPSAAPYSDPDARRVSTDPMPR